MSAYRFEPTRPGILTVITIISFLWSGLTVLRVILWAIFALLLGAGSWLLGPVVGAIGSLVGLASIVGMIALSVLSILLFSAALHTAKGDPTGRSLHQGWAWLTLILDGLALVVTGFLSPMAWWGLLYAIGVLYVMSQPEVRAYFDRYLIPPGRIKSGGYLDDAF
jgi:hypothetical protein